MDLHYIDSAIKLAKRARDMDEFPVGAMVISDGDIVGKGFNQKESLKDPTAHAEDFSDSRCG